MATAAAVAVLFAACSSGSVDTGSADSAVTITGEPAAPLPEPAGTEPVASTDASGGVPSSPAGDGGSDALQVPAALQFRAPLVGGGEIDLAAGFTGLPTVFWFWAPT
jgi:hypothetical protein